jgi:hypothetical protein
MPISIKFDELEWKDPPRGYYISDVKQKTLYINEETGAQWVLMKWPPGLLDEKHTHPKANQLAVPISGPRAGKMVSITKKGEVHGAAEIPEEMLVLFYWDGPPDPEKVE